MTKKISPSQFRQNRLNAFNGSWIQFRDDALTGEGTCDITGQPFLNTDYFITPQLPTG